MPNAFNGLGAGAPYVPDYLQDEIQFRIDNDLRTIAIPADGVVLGVVGDKNVNHVNFQMPAWYNGFDMSTFQARINFIDASGNANYYTVTDMTVMTPEGTEVEGTPGENDIIYFTWLVDSYATGYVGQVRFNVRLTKYDTSINPAVLSQAFNTQINSCQVLEGIQLADEITQEQAEDILFHMTAELQDVTDSLKLDLEAKGQEVRDSLPDDYVEITEDYVELSEDVDNLKNDLNYAGINLSILRGQEIITGKYITYNTGVESTISTYSYVITSIEENSEYILDGDGGRSQIAFFNGDTYVSGILNPVGLFKTPSGVTKMSISFDNSFTDTVRVTKPSSIKNSELIDNGNLWDESKLVRGKFVQYNNGLEATLTEYSYIRINVAANTEYFFFGDDSYSQIAFFNGSTYLSGVLSPSRVITTPNNATVMTVSVSNRSIESIVLQKKTRNSEGKCIDSNYIDSFGVIEKSGLGMKSIISKNNSIDGKFVMYNTGIAQVQSSYAYIRVSIKPNTKYILIGDSGYSQLAFFNGDAFVSGILNPVGEFTTPNNANFVAYSFPLTDKNSVEIFEVVELSGVKLNNSALDTEYIKKIVTEEKVLSKTVDINGTGDFSTIADALAFVAGQPADVKTIITVKPGTYNEVQMNIIGNFELIGIDKTKTIIVGDGNDVSSDVPDRNERHIFRNITGKTTAVFKNLTLQGNDIKYCLHLENAGGNVDVLVDNCLLENNNPSIGVGLRANQHITIRNCMITVNDSDYGWKCGVFMHNWNDESAPCGIELNNVRVSNGQLLQLECMNSGNQDDVKVVNSTSSEPGNPITFKMTNNPDCESITLELIGDYSLLYDYDDISNDTLHHEGVFDTYVYNNSDSTISQYNVVMIDYTDTNLGRKSVLKSDGSRIYGIALNDIPARSYGWVSLPYRSVQYTYNASVGTTYTVNSSGELVESDTNVVAFCRKAQKFSSETNQRTMLCVVKSEL